MTRFSQLLASSVQIGVLAAVAAVAAPSHADVPSAEHIGPGREEAAAPSAARIPDQIVLVSTRAVGVGCNSEAMARLHFEELCNDHDRRRQWRRWNHEEATANLSAAMPTVIYVHGNRIEPGEDKSHGLMIYRAMNRDIASNEPIRFIIFSWPAAQIPGPLKDYVVKAERTRPVGWQLAWFVDRLPMETPVALVGYSYGARVVTGSLHVLAGGSLGGLRLVERAHPHRPPVRAALIAAAVDLEWMRPGGFHGRALCQVDELFLVNNQRDPAMRFYRMSPVGSGAALGYAGLAGACLPSGHVWSIDVTHEVGRHHAIGAYLTSTRQVSKVLRQVATWNVMPGQWSTLPAESLADRAAGRDNHQ